MAQLGGGAALGGALEVAFHDEKRLVHLLQGIGFLANSGGDGVDPHRAAAEFHDDGLEDARELAQFCKHIPCKINLIEYNPIDDGEFQQTTPERLNDFVALLEDRNLIVNVRRSRGKDIDAACGQLANKNAAGEEAPRKEVSRA